MAHPLTLERFLNFILNRNISPTFDETSARNMLTELFAEQQENFGAPDSILIGLPVDRYDFEDADLPNSLRAYVTYIDTNILGQVAQYFNNRISFGRRLIMNNILIDNPNSPLFRARFAGREYFRIEGNGGYLDTQEINGYQRIVFSHLNYVIDLSTPIDEESYTTDAVHNNMIGGNDNNNMIGGNDNNIPSTQETDYFSIPNNDNEINESQGNDYVFRCNRCLEFYGNNQAIFDSHIEQCKNDERTSMAFCIRQANCTICQYKFLQTSTANMRFLPCGHLLHRDCYERMLEMNHEVNAECPNCKARIPYGWIGQIQFNTFM